MYSQNSLCIEYKMLAKMVFDMLGEDRIINHQTGEETITDLIIRKLKFWEFKNSNSNFSVKNFTKKKEAVNGADFEWDWYFVDSSQSKWLGFRLQAKILNLKTDKFLSLDHSNKNGHQIDLLINSSNKDNRIPFYCFYLHKYGENSLKGCSLSTPNHVKQLLMTSKKPNVDDVLAISFPWHLIFCNKNARNISLPNRLLVNLRDELKFNGINLLSKSEVLALQKLSKIDGEIYDPEEYPFGSAPQRITIIRENKNYG